MNIIRSKIVELNTIPAIAYKIKMKTGGSGVKIHRTDVDETAFAKIDKRTGGIRRDVRVSEDIFPEEAFDEAVGLLIGMPFSARGKVKFIAAETADTDEIAAPEDEAPGVHDDISANVVDSDEFTTIIAMYADLSGKMNYQLMNKHFIQFAARNKTVADMVGKNASVEDILLYIVKNRAAYFTDNKELLPDDMALALIDAIEDIDPRSAFKELKLHIRKMLSR